ncbi:winged helix-turn-helix transcriptional regulator [Pseudonocardia xinjiangensis]|uniref:winged helix-turn-helix transcriptional regulator n=1 Tax=Pseudonocardia xinjiangensis TaxID=75289 RepID=UPI003D90D2D8
MEYDGSVCSVARTAAVLSDTWTVLVLRDVRHGVRRFDDLTAHLGIARNVLTRRLATLVDAGILDRVPYREAGSRLRHEYVLTQAGQDLVPVIIAMMGWGDRYRADPDGPPMRVEHAECGSPVHVELRCTDGHRIDPQEGLRTTPGPGARRTPTGGCS